MGWIIFAVLCVVLAAVVLFGYPLFCLLRRFWGWRRLRQAR